MKMEENKDSKKKQETEKSVSITLLDLVKMFECPVCFQPFDFETFLKLFLQAGKLSSLQSSFEWKI